MRWGIQMIPYPSFILWRAWRKKFMKMLILTRDSFNQVISSSIKQIKSKSLVSSVHCRIYYLLELSFMQRETAGADRPVAPPSG